MMGDLRFNSVAALYSRVRPTYPDAVYDHLLEAGNCQRFEQAIDIGSGAGQSVAGLRRIAERVIGVEPADKLLVEARQSYPDVEFREGTGESTGLPDACADLVTVATAFYWMDKERALAEVDRILRPAGVFSTYKYDFPQCIGPANAVLEAHLTTHWNAHRSARLTEYDDTADLMRACGFIDHVKARVVPYVLTYPSSDGFVELMCSTSYVSAFLRSIEDADGYIECFAAEMRRQSEGELQVRFDILMNIGCKA